MKAFGQTLLCVEYALGGMQAAPANSLPIGGRFLFSGAADAIRRLLC